MRLAIVMGLVGLACGGGRKPVVNCQNTAEPILPDGIGRVTPSEADLREARKNGLAELVVVVNVCVNFDGTANRTTLMESSGFPCYDDKVLSTVERSTFSHLTRATDQCGKVTVRYNVASEP